MVSIASSSLTGSVIFYHRAFFQCGRFHLHEYFWELYCTQELWISFLKQGWNTAARKDGGSQLKTWLCFPGTCNFWGHNAFLSFLPAFSALLHASIWHVLSRLASAWPWEKGRALTFQTFPTNWFCQENVQEFRCCYEIFLLICHSACTINRKLFASLTSTTEFGGLRRPFLIW